MIYTALRFFIVENIHNTYNQDFFFYAFIYDPYSWLLKYDGFSLKVAHV